MAICPANGTSRDTVSEGERQHCVAVSANHCGRGVAQTVTEDNLSPSQASPSIVVHRRALSSLHCRALMHLSQYAPAPARLLVTLPATTLGLAATAHSPVPHVANFTLLGP